MTNIARVDVASAEPEMIIGIFDTACVFAERSVICHALC